MTRKTIPQTIPTLPARAQGEPPFSVSTDGYATHHVFTLETPNLQDLDALREQSYIDGYVLLSKLDGYGEPTGQTYVQILLSQTQLSDMNAANQTHRVGERMGLASARRPDLPSWAKQPNGAPAHVFWGHNNL